VIVLGSLSPETEGSSNNRALKLTARRWIAVWCGSRHRYLASPQIFCKAGSLLPACWTRWVETVCLSSATRISPRSCQRKYEYLHRMLNLIHSWLYLRVPATHQVSSSECRTNLATFTMPRTTRIMISLRLAYRTLFRSLLFCLETDLRQKATLLRQIHRV
jgi:hypothetical protein